MEKVVAGGKAVIKVVAVVKAESCFTIKASTHLALYERTPHLALSHLQLFTPQAQLHFWGICKSVS